MAKVCSWDDSIVSWGSKIIDGGEDNPAFQQAEFLDSMHRVRRGIESAIGEFSGALWSGNKPHQWYRIDQCYDWYSPEIWCWGDVHSGILDRSKLADKLDLVEGVKVLSFELFVRPAGKTILEADWDRLENLADQRKWEPLIWCNDTSRRHEALIPERLISPRFEFAVYAKPCRYSCESFDVDEMRGLGLEVQFQTQIRCEPLRRLLFEVGRSDDEYLISPEE